MHVSFQQKLSQLRLETIKTYKNFMSDGEGAFAENKELQLQLNAEILGLGPKCVVYR